MSQRTSRGLGSLSAALVGLLVAALLAGCGTVGRPGTAVVVDNQVYTPAQIVETTAQINTALGDSAEKATEAQIVNLLVLSPFVVSEATRSGLWTPDAQYNSFLGKIHNPTPTTVTALQGNSAFFALDQAGKANVLAAMKKATITVDPRYGAIDYSTGFLGMPTPGWIARTAPVAPAK